MPCALVHPSSLIIPEDPGTRRAGGAFIHLRLCHCDTVLQNLCAQELPSTGEEGEKGKRKVDAENREDGELSDDDDDDSLLRQEPKTVCR
ncbi:hypothetical protein E2C01_064105 [Portunus trituberculatus]|uniref:Uncharacterized protein n=1 Tax=Portunus trituberculatus TaxID=210409 RepID=A0A5B7HI66_PORTR|nr:hypothetical protein [Portunus trituberculatus]